MAERSTTKSLAFSHCPVTGPSHLNCFNIYVFSFWKKEKEKKSALETDGGRKKNPNFSFSVKNGTQAIKFIEWG